MNFEKYLLSCRSLVSPIKSMTTELSPTSSIVKAYHNLYDIVLEGQARKINDKVIVVLATHGDGETIPFHKLQMIIDNSIKYVCILDAKIFDDSFDYYERINSIYNLFDTIVSADIQLGLDDIDSDFGDLLYQIPMVLTVKFIYDIYRDKNIAGFHLRDVLQDEFYNLEVVELVYRQSLQELINEYLILKIISVAKEEQEKEEDIVEEKEEDAK